MTLWLLHRASRGRFAGCPPRVCFWWFRGRSWVRYYLLVLVFCICFHGYYNQLCRLPTFINFSSTIYSSTYAHFKSYKILGDATFVRGRLWDGISRWERSLLRTLAARDASERIYKRPRAGTRSCSLGLKRRKRDLQTGVEVERRM